MFQSGCHGNWVTIATRYAADAFISKNLHSKYKLNITQKGIIEISLWLLWQQSYLSNEVCGWCVLSQGFCGLLLNGRETIWNRCHTVHVYCNNSTYLQSLPSHHQCRCYIHAYMCVHDSETDDCGTVWGGNIHKIIILMEVKTQEQVLKLFQHV